MFIADFHIHSKYSRATSKECVPEMLALWGRRKGLHLIGTGDFTHPAWRAELAEKLVPAEEGLYALKPEHSLPDPLLADCAMPRFVLSAEISSIYKKDGRVRKVHNVILLPNLEAAETLSHRLEAIGNLHSDGRPILGLDSRDLLEITLESCPEALFIPAHIWTPHFSLFGAYSGFDTIEACFEDLTPHIHALETGLSSDPPMNWRLSSLDRFAMVSNSDAHSPGNLAREANLFDTALSYPALTEALRQPDSGAFLGTLEFFPEEGKYHCDGHRHCKACLTPTQTRAADGLCPICGKPVTVGVLHRVEALADRPEGFIPPGSRRYESLVPLREVAAASLGVTPASGKAQKAYEALLQALGSELYILREAPLEDIQKKAGPLIAEGIRRLREGKVDVRPGYDGAYGKVTLLSPDEISALSGQVSLLEQISLPAPASATKQTKPRQPAKEKATPAPKAPPADSALPYGLNEAQWAAVSTPSPIVSVVAGPGTGKTKTLVSRIAYLVEQRGVPPEAITAVTFTNKAAAEMRTRLAQHFQDEGMAKRMTIGTFHAICLRLLSASRPQSVTLLTEPDALALLGDVLAAQGCAMRPRDALAAISLCKNGAAQPGDSGLPQAVFDAYNEQLRAYDAMDYDDILLEALALFGAGMPAPRAFPQLLVDEFQDISPVQYRLIQAWAGTGEGLFLIGDPDQAIYGFRGSDARCFTKLAADYPEAAQIHLTQNFRSTPEILRAAHSVMAAQPGRQATPMLEPMRAGGEPVRLLRLDSAFAEAVAVAKAINRMVGGIDMLDAHSAPSKAGKRTDAGTVRGFSDIAVLLRTHRQAAALEQCFAQEGIPYVVAGREPFLAEPSVRQAVAFFRLLENPADLVSLRICAEEAGFYRKADAQALLAAYRDGDKTLSTLEALLAACPPVTSLDRPLSLAALLAKYAPMLADGKPASLVDAWIYDNALSADPAMERLRNTAVMHGDMASFLYALALGRESDVQRSGGNRYRLDAVTIMTLHGAKGLEFPAVFLCGASEGLLPFQGRRGASDASEERRLFYVGITRARDTLCLLSHGEPSPFLRDMDQSVLAPAETTVKAKNDGAQLSFL